MKPSYSAVCLLSCCLVGPLCRAQGFLNLDFESADTSTIFGGDPALIPATNAIPYWTAYEGSGRVTLDVTYNSYYATTGGQIGLYDGGPQFPGWPVWLPPPIAGQYSVFLGSGWGWPGGGEGSGDEFISQTGQVPLGSRSVRFSTSNGGLDPNWDAPYELTVSLDGQVIPYTEVARDAASLTFAGDVSSFSGNAAELRFYLHRLDAAPDEAILLGLDDIFFSSEVVPEPSSLSLLGAGMVVVVMHMGRKRVFS